MSSAQTDEQRRWSEKAELEERERLQAIVARAHRLEQQVSALRHEISDLRAEVRARTSAAFADACARVRAAVARHRSLAPLLEASAIEQIATTALTLGDLDALPEAMKKLALAVKRRTAKPTLFAATTELVLEGARQRARRGRQP